MSAAMPMSIPIKRALFAFSDMICASRAALGFQLSQQLLDAVFFFQGGEAVFHVGGQELDFGFSDGFFASYFFLHAVEGGGFAVGVHARLRVGSAMGHAGAAVLRNQQIGLG